MLELLFLLPATAVFLGIFTYYNTVRIDLVKRVRRKKFKNTT